MPRSALLLVLLVLFAWVGPLLRRTDPDALDLGNTVAAASAAHPLGTDESGRDILARLMAGGRVSLAVGTGATAVALLLGTLVGAAAGWRGGWAGGRALPGCGGGMAGRLARRAAHARYRRGDGGAAALRGPRGALDLRQPAGAARRRDRRHLMDRRRAPGPRRGPRAPRRRVRPGGPRAGPGRRRDRGAPPPPPARPDAHRRRQRRRGVGDPHRIGALLPRARRPAAPCELGEHADRRPGLALHRAPAGTLARPHDPPHDARLQRPGRGAPPAPHRSG